MAPGDYGEKAATPTGAAMTIPIQGIMDSIVSLFALVFALALSEVWIYLALIPVLILVCYFVFSSRISDSCIGYVVYQSRWEQWRGITWQGRMSR